VGNKDLYNDTGYFYPRLGAGQEKNETGASLEIDLPKRVLFYTV
jgi:hypothetical protein